MSRIIVIFLPLLIAILIVVFLLWPKYQEVKLLYVEIEEKKAEIKYQEELITNLNNLSQKLGEYQSELQKINFVLPQEPSPLSLFNFLQKKASENGLILKEISPFSIAPLKEKERINQTIFSCKVSGSYSALKNFLSALEKNARMIEIEGISFSAPTKKEILPFYEITIKTYSY